MAIFFKGTRTWRQFAQECGISPTLMSMIRNGKRNLTMGIADAICTAHDGYVPAADIKSEQLLSTITMTVIPKTK